MRSSSLVSALIAAALGLLFAAPAAFAAPDTTITQAPGAATSDTTPRFRFTSTPPGATFECRVDGGGWAPCTTPHDTAALGNGPHTFEVRAVDVGPDPDPTPASHAFFVDNVRPNTTLTSQPASPLLDDNTPEFEFTGSDAAPSSGLDGFQCRVDTGPWDPCTSSHTTAALSDGEHDFRVRAVDAAGNVDSSPASFLNFTVDTVDPALNVTTVPNAISTDPTPTFEFTGSDAVPSSGLSFRCRLDGGSWSGCSSPHQPNLSDGFHTLEIEAVDGAGNTDGSAFSHTWFIDTVNPDTTITNEPPTDLLGYSPSFEFSGSDSAPSSGLVGFECRIDGGGWAPCISPVGGFADGVHTFEVRSIDAAGNVDGSPASFDFTVDTQLPETAITAHPSQYSNDTSPSFEFQGSDPAPSSGVSFRCRLDGGAWQPCTSPHGISAPEGNHTFEVKAVDGVGNEDPTPASYSWMVDTTPPEITIDEPDNKDRFLLHHGNSQHSCDDPLSGGPPQVASGFPPAGGLHSNGGPGCTATPFNDEDLGPHFFEVTATDFAGNTSTKKVAYTIDPPAYRDLIDEDDPLAYYRHDEPVGSDEMLDSSPNHHDGIYQNGIALGRDGATSCERRPHPPRACELAHPPENKAAYFGPRDDHGYVNGITAPTEAYSMEAWVKPRDGADMMVMGHGGGGQLFISGGKLAFRQTQDTIYSNAAVPPGQWSHVGATWDGHTTRLYVNGHQVAHSTNANKPPSGTSTFYVGYGEMAPWFHGTIDESAYYDHALTAHDFDDRYKTGTAFDHPSLERGNSPFNTEGPSTDPEAPKNNGLYAPNKTPHADFHCEDPDDLPGDSDVASCTATVDGNPIANHDPLPDSIGTHTFVVTAIDKGGNTYIHTHTYRVMNFADLFGADNPLAYYRLGDPAGSSVMADSSANHNDGEYKNDQDSGPVGISGDGDRARDFFGAGGYGYVNGITAPPFQMTLEAWVNADDADDASIVGHGGDSDAGEIYIKDGYFRFRHMDTEVVSSVPVNPGHFQQVVGTWDGVDIRIYVDGVETGKVEQTKRPSSVNTFYVGYGEMAPWFRGTIDEVAYYETALPPARVFQHWLADPPPADLTENPDDPTDPPVDPEDPTDPTDPTDPVDPTDPTDPVDPTDPTRPSTRSTRATPAIPRSRPTIRP